MAWLFQIESPSCLARSRGPGRVWRRIIGNLTESTLTFVRNHEAWAPVVVFALSFGESLAIVSLILPATVILLGAGTVMAAAELGFWPIWAGAVLGAVFGDWISYWFGYRFSDRVGGLWPLSRHPELLPRGQRFFEKWGALGVFFGRFLGPLRSVMPLVAGICGMRQLPFQAANIASALLWATSVLAPGTFVVRWFL